MGSVEHLMIIRAKSDAWSASQLTALASELERGAFQDALATATRILQIDPNCEAAKSALVVATAELEFGEVNRTRMGGSFEIAQSSMMSGRGSRPSEFLAPAASEPAHPPSGPATRSSLLDEVDSPFADELSWSELPAPPAISSGPARSAFYELDDPSLMMTREAPTANISNPLMPDAAQTAPFPILSQVPAGPLSDPFFGRSHSGITHNGQSVRIRMASESSAVDNTLSPLTAAYAGSSSHPEDVSAMYMLCVDGQIAAAADAARVILEREPDNAVASVVLLECESAVTDRATSPPAAPADGSVPDFDAVTAERRTFNG
jgi:hypothetical protein